MRKAILILCVLMLLVPLAACDKIKLADTEESAQTNEGRTAELESESDRLESEEDPALAEATVEPEATPTESPEATEEVKETPTGNPNMYSSFAHMVSFDTEKGWAEFDYFEIMTGDEAIDALVKYEGYDLTDAQVEVMGWEEGGYYEKNTNPQLRTIDLGSVDVRMIMKTDGSLINDIGNPPQYSLNDVKALYTANPVYLFDYFDYFVTVDENGNVTKIEQIYRP